MNNLQAILKVSEESVRTVGDPELRKIAFQEVLRHQLRFNEASPNKPGREATTNSRRPKGRSSPAPKATGQAAVRPEVAALDLSPDERSLAPWSTLTADWKKFCWVLEAAHQKKVDGLTNSEISHLIEKVFRENYKAEVVNNLKVQIKKGMVKPVTIVADEREYRVWKILNAGIKEVTAKPAAVE